MPVLPRALPQERRRASSEHVGKPYNLYIRDLEYLYPGESHEIWVHFQTQRRKETPQASA